MKMWEDDDASVRFGVGVSVSVIVDMGVRVSVIVDMGVIMGWA